MTIEEKLKEYILAYYKSIREFTQKADIPYSTMDGVLKRGIANSSISSILKICNALGISADELANNKIVLSSKSSSHILISEIPEMLIHMRKYKENYHDLSIDGQILNEHELETLLDVVELSVELIRRKRERLN